MITYLTIFLLTLVNAEDYLILRIASNNEKIKEDLEGSSVIHLIPGGHHLIYTIFEDHEVNDIESFCLEYLKNPEKFIFVSKISKTKVNPPEKICQNKKQSNKQKETKIKSELYNATFSFEKSSTMKNTDISIVYRYGFLALLIIEESGSSNILLFDDIPRSFKFNRLRPGTQIYLQYFDQPNLSPITNDKIREIQIPNQLLVVFRFKLVKV